MISLSTRPPSTTAKCRAALTCFEPGVAESACDPISAITGYVQVPHPFYVGLRGRVVT